LPIPRWVALITIAVCALFQRYVDFADFTVRLRTARFPHFAALFVTLLITFVTRFDSLAVVPPHPLIVAH